jgi:lipopolysaccharide biosynthesis glycosyltransferase
MLKSKNLNIYLGYDPKESIAWHVMAQSLIETSSEPLAIHPVSLKNYSKVFKRTTDPQQSNEFSFSRFMVPYLQSYSGTALFLDCDMLMRADVAELFKIAHNNPDKAVHVVKHDYTPKSKIKFLGKTQYAYPRKNWSSVVLWNCEHPSNRKLSLSFVNNGTGAELHRFSWLQDSEIGELDVHWNWLVGEYDSRTAVSKVNNVHWTIGGPYFNEYSNADFSEEWRAMESKMLRCDQLEPAIYRVK